MEQSIFQGLDNIALALSQNGFEKYQTFWAAIIAFAGALLAASIYSCSGVNQDLCTEKG